MRDSPELSSGQNAADLRRVFVRDYTLDASIGVHPHELEKLQPIIVSLDLSVRPADKDFQLVFMPPPRDGDELARNVVCYESLTNMVRRLAQSGHIDYVETMCEQIATHCLEDDRIMEVTVIVEKPEAITDARAAGVALTRCR
ncbi:MAG: dihydroneopterin aldolase [Pseudomonadota bacterium]